VPVFRQNISLEDVIGSACDQMTFLSGVHSSYRLALYFSSKHERSQSDEVSPSYRDMVDNTVTGHEFLHRTIGDDCPTPGRCVRFGWQIDMFSGYSATTPSLWVRCTCFRQQVFALSRRDLPLSFTHLLRLKHCHVCAQ
jgi:hypothetical protein